VVWSDLANLETGTGHKQKAYAKSRPVEFTVRYDDQITTGTAIVSALQKRGYHCVIITVFPVSLLFKICRLLIRLVWQFRENKESRCQVPLFPCSVQDM
jgi:hypothetical protein